MTSPTETEFNGRAFAIAFSEMEMETETMHRQKRHACSSRDSDSEAASMCQIELGRQLCLANLLPHPLQFPPGMGKGILLWNQRHVDRERILCIVCGPSMEQFNKCWQE